MRDGKLFEPILDVVIDTMPRDNLLNSACLELFDYIYMNNITNIICHLVENYREKLKLITYAPVFKNFIQRYDDTGGFAPSMETSFLDTEDESQSQKRPAAGRGYTGIKDLDAEEEHYFNTSDDEDDSPNKASSSRSSINGASPLSKPLVDYNSDEENENMDMEEVDGGADENTPPTPSKSPDTKPVSSLVPSPVTPPEKLSEKRRREDEDEDEMSKLSQPKRRNSASSQGSATLIRRKKPFVNATHENTSTRSKSKKIAISISPAIKTGGESPGGENGGS
jgi:protein phosphatase-4 regulatory subunit 3